MHEIVTKATLESFLKSRKIRAHMWNQNIFKKK